jgi:dienelactone hydrolase
MTTSATLLIASDIFGMTDAFRRLARSLCRRPVPGSAHADPSLSFIDETEAYARFVEAGGVGAYAARIRRILTERPDISGLVGFSAGASAGWVVSATSVWSSPSGSVPSIPRPWPPAWRRAAFPPRWCPVRATGS